MSEMIKWVSSNKEWLFDGLLVAIPIALLHLYSNKKSGGNEQRQNTGDNSKNFQAGRDIKNTENKND